jgi:cobalt/nickel transport system permease protein
MVATASLLAFHAPSFILHPFLPFAVHIPDNLLNEWWVMGGFVVAAALALFGGWRVRDEEISQLGLMTAAFFVASLIHIPLGVSSVHLVFNGLLGVVLGRRATLAIPVGVFLQAVLFQHGGYSTIGVNSCVMTIPALLAWQLFRLLEGVPWVRKPWFRMGLVTVSAATWIVGALYGVALLFFGRWSDSDSVAGRVNQILLHPLTWVAVLVVGLLVAWWELRLENAPEFPLGLFVGETAILATVGLHCMVLALGGFQPAAAPQEAMLNNPGPPAPADAGGHEESGPGSASRAWQFVASLIFLAHLPLAAVEGVILGFTVGFLARVKPQMLNLGKSRYRVHTTQ